MRASLALFMALFASSLLPACRKPATPLAPARATPTQDSCAILPDSGSMPQHLTVAFTERLDPSWLIGSTNRANQFLTGLLYQPLVRVTCDDSVVPALAAS